MQNLSSVVVLSQKQVTQTHGAVPEFGQNQPFVHGWATQWRTRTDGDVYWGASGRVGLVVVDRVGALVRVHVAEQQQVDAILIPERLIPAHTML